MSEKKNQTGLRRRQRRGYQIDLADLHALCEVNYHRLMRLFPDYEQRSDWDFMERYNPVAQLGWLQRE